MGWMGVADLWKSRTIVCSCRASYQEPARGTQRNTYSQLYCCIQPGGSARISGLGGGEAIDNRVNKERAESRCHLYCQIMTCRHSFAVVYAVRPCPSNSAETGTQSTFLSNKEKI